jgi:PqqD family protein of HPr-rel-A system
LDLAGICVQPKFNLNPAVRLHWCSWAGECVVFEEASGQTHILDPLRAFVLNSIADSPQTLEELLLDISTAIVVEQTEEIERLAQLALREFETLGLLERSSV